MRYKKKLPSLDILRNLFQYDPNTGTLLRKLPEGKSRRVGCISGNGYLRVNACGTQFAAHRIIWKMIHENEPAEIDHINGVRTDNRISNLREATNADNNRNIEISPRSSSGYSGVSFVKRDKKWRAYIKVGKKQICAGSFKDKKDAVIAYNEMAIRLHGEFAERKVSANKKKLLEEYGS